MREPNKARKKALTTQTPVENPSCCAAKENVKQVKHGLAPTNPKPDLHDWGCHARGLLLFA